MVASGWGSGERIDCTERHKGTFWNDGNVLYIDCAGGFIDIYNCQHSLNCTLKNE